MFPADNSRPAASDLADKVVRRVERRTTLFATGRPVRKRRLFGFETVDHRLPNTELTWSSASLAEPFDDDAIAGVNGDHVERFGPDGGEAVRRIGSDDDDVVGTGNDFFSIYSHGRFAGVHDARFGIGMPV
jgi:hypothetical protein